MLETAQRMHGARRLRVPCESIAPTAVAIEKSTVSGGLRRVTAFTGVRFAPRMDTVPRRHKQSRRFLIASCAMIMELWAEPPSSSHLVCRSSSTVSNGNSDVASSEPQPIVRCSLCPRKFAASDTFPGPKQSLFKLIYRQIFAYAPPQLKKQIIMSVSMPLTPV